MWYFCNVNSHIQTMFNGALSLFLQHQIREGWAAVNTPASVDLPNPATSVETFKLKPEGA